MKQSTKLFLFFLLVTLFIPCFSQHTLASEGNPTIKVAMSEDESIIVERIVYTALKQLGYQMTTKTAGMRTMVNDVNYGDAAIVPAQTLGLDEEYTNLIRVPVPISFVELNAYARSEDNYTFNSWNDLSGLRLSHCWKNLFVSKNVSRANASQVVMLNEYEDLWQSLLTNETDVAVIPNLTGFVRIVPKGVKLAGVIQREPRYTYVNKNYDYLVPLLTEVYQEMTDNGTMEMIRNSQQSGERRIVLHISSYNSRVEWERNEIEAIRKYFEFDSAIEYQNMNLNARQGYSRININDIIANTIRTNFAERNPDIIIASDNDALEFVLNNYYMLFPKVPVVFCGVNDFDMSMLEGFEDHVTGVSESDSVYETITEMLRMYPQTRRVYILNDYTNSGLKWRESIEKSLQKYNLPVELEFNENESLNDILKSIRGFDTDTLVLIGTFFLDSEKTFYLEPETQQLVCDASKMPVFCLADSFNGYGTLGGRVSVGETQGERAGSMAYDILMGKKISEIPVVTDSDPLNRWQFDYEVVEKFNINVNIFPAGHTIINRRLNIWETNPLEFKLAMAAGGLFLVIITALVLFIRLMRKKNARLIEIQSHLHSAEDINEMLSQAAEREKEANMLKSLFLSNMSHEIRTPINAITGMTQIGKASSDLKRKDYAFEKIENASNHLLGVINDILDMSKIEANKLELSYVTFDFEKMLQKVVNIVNFRIEEKQQLFTVYLDKNIPRSFFGDDQRVAQITTNLLSNAVKFTPVHGSIQLRAYLLNDENDLCMIQIEVIDTGIGIDPARQSHLFEAFEQADINTSRLYGGSGLGLAISKRIVELMGGNIGFTSTFGEGSTFYFSIPLKRASKESLFAAKNDITRDKIRVLMVDDEREIRESFSNMAEHLEIACDTASGGEEAVQLMKNNAYDLYFIDWNMPSMNGLELAHELSINNKDNTVVLMISDAEWRFIEADAKNASIGMFLHKPFFPSSISTCVDEYLGINNKAYKEKIQNETISLKGVRILLVEDVEINREIVLTLLEQTQASVDCAENGAEALQMVSDQPDHYHLILMDMQMPKMDGLEATRRIRALDHPNAKKIPVIAMTANVFKENINQCEEAGMNDHVGKPIDYEKMVHTILRNLPANR